MHGIDWAILAGAMLALAIFSLYSVRHVKGVADFLSANRSGGRYMLTIAGGMAGAAAISTVGKFEMYYAAGFGPLWWNLMHIPLGAIIILSGYVYYRFRETRAMTMAQFFEMRYSKSFRVYAGIVQWASGVVNFGIFPIVEARFLVYFCGLPTTLTIGGWTLPTVAPVMAVTIGISLLFACMGGQITVMVTDCAQGLFCGFAYILIVGFLLMRFPWSDLVAGLQIAPEHASMLNPFDTSKVRDFNVWFFLIGVFCSLYGYMSWQGSAGYQSCALNAHEQKMGAIIGTWRALTQTMMIVLIPLVAYTVMHLPRYAAQAAEAQAVVATVPTATLQTQMRVPIVLAHVLPTGLRGLFATIMLFFLITTQDTYMHSWGSMFIQDVVLPFRKKPFDPKTQVLLLRLSVIGVGVFAFVFGLTFKMREYIVMFFAITGAIVSGAGACIVGGMYWRRGTPAGAWTAITLGWVLVVIRIATQQAGPAFADASGLLAHCVHGLNSVNSQVIHFWIVLICIAGYVIVSLLTRNEEGFVMERILHRGPYAIRGDHVEKAGATVSRWMRLVGITKEFSRTDRFLAYAVVVWNFGWLGVFIAGVIYNLTIGMSADAWAMFWRVWFLMHIGIGIPATLWMAVGGILDMRKFFHRLTVLGRNVQDDGRVIHHHLPDEPE